MCIYHTQCSSLWPSHTDGLGEEEDEAGKDEYLAPARIYLGGTANLVRNSDAPIKYLGEFFRANILGEVLETQPCQSEIRGLLQVK